jgi:Holliday junction DNA helicase RuvB
MSDEGIKALIREQLHAPQGDATVEAWIGFSEASQKEDSVELPPSIRPSCFDEFIGHENLKRNLVLSCNAAKQRGEPLDHVLFHGPPGLGKTSLARIVAAQLGVGFKSTAGPILERAGDLAALLSALQSNDVLFIDEIHRMPRAIEEVLYPAMEDYHIDIIIGQGPAARSIKVPLKPFTLIGATTRTGLLTSPLRDRFGIIERLEFYSPLELQAIATRSARILNVNIAEDAAAEIGRRSRGTPRIANRVLKRVRDFAQDRGSPTITYALTQEALSLLEIDTHGLDRMDRQILRLMIERYDGGPVGIEALAATLGEDRNTLEEVYEPFLLQEGLLARGRRGREVTALGYQYLGIKSRTQAALPLVQNPEKSTVLKVGS